jgi:hypothetical protein
MGENAKSSIHGFELETLRDAWGASRGPGPLDPEGDLGIAQYVFPERTADGRLHLTIVGYEHGDCTHLRDWAEDEYGGAVELKLALRPTLVDWQPGGLVERTIVAMQEAIAKVRAVTDNDDDDCVLPEGAHIVCSTGWPILSDLGMTQETRYSRSELASLAVGTELRAHNGKVFTKIRQNEWKGPASGRGTTAETAAQRGITNPENDQ